MLGNKIYDSNRFIVEYALPSVEFNLLLLKRADNQSYPPMINVFIFELWNGIVCGKLVDQFL